jgi:hypothetical protein
MTDGFLGRWSKRKLESKQGKVVEAQLLPPAQPLPAPEEDQTAEPFPLAETGADTPTDAAGVVAGLPAEEVGVEGRVEAPPALTLEDVAALTPESDYARFAAREVTAEVKNAALRKLFADPRYNLMDGLDVYTGDYAKPDPIPNSMLRQLTSAKFLGLFDEEERQEEAERRARDVADNPTGQTVAQSGAVPQAVPEPPEHADPDLRLQQDHAAPGEDPGRGTG